MKDLDPELRAALAARFPELVPAEGDLDPSGPLVPADQHVAFARFLKEACGFTLYVSSVGSHWPAQAEGEPEHYEVATVLRRPPKPSAVFWWRVRIRTDETVPTLFPLFAGADWQEREQYDLVGVVYEGHPDLRRLMMPEDYEAHPLRKEFAIETPYHPWR